MFDPPVPMLEELHETLHMLAGVSGDGADEAGLIELLGALERLKGAAAAAQARTTVTLVDVRHRREAIAGIPADRRGQGLASEIALARHASPHRGARDLGMAKALVHEMPNTLAGLTAGDISEWRATLLVRETAVLSHEDRSRVDEALADRLASSPSRRESPVRQRSPGTPTRSERRATHAAAARSWRTRWWNASRARSSPTRSRSRFPW